MSGKDYERGKAQSISINKERELLRCKSSGNNRGIFLLQLSSESIRLYRHIPNGGLIPTLTA
ncbi:MAG: hypothetical protein WBI82_03830 [Sphaerochaeta sp.]